MIGQFETSFLTIALEEFLSMFDSAVLTNEAGEILAMRYANISDIGTYGPMVRTVTKYFQPQEGDFILLNDPYSGGSLLFAVGLLTSIQLGQQKFFLAARIRLKPLLVFANKVEEEGVRIPPTPLVINHKINEAILDAIDTNPLTPPFFRQSILELIEKMNLRVKRFHQAFAVHEKILSTANQKSLLKFTREKTKEKLADIQHGEAKFEMTLSSGEILRLHAELTAEKFSCDFRGTSPSKCLHVNNIVAYGACVGGLLAFLGSDIPLNEGFFSVVDVSIPQDSFIAAKYPAPLTRGIVEALHCLSNAVMTVLSTIHPKEAIAHNSAVIPTLLLDFKNNFYIDVMPGGTGATTKTNGVDGLHFWTRERREMSVEMIEHTYPLLLLQNGIRKHSGGKGQHAGGDGIIREYKVLEDCEARWVVGSKNVHANGSHGGGSGHAADIYITDSEGNKKSLPEEMGSLKLKANDRIVIMSAGGGGYGKTVSPPEKK